ncbi:MAG: MOSC domain-containing protein [Candidatus Eisenbacteria bacterium]
MGTPTVVSLHLNVGSRQPLARVERVSALLEQGLEGDRHLKADGRRTVLLMEQEVLDGFDLAPGAVREQVTVRGLALMTLVFGSRLRIGDVTLEVAGPCAPCERMNELKPGLRAALEGRRGRFVRVVQAGSFAVGDAIAVAPPV